MIRGGELSNCVIRAGEHDTQSGRQGKQREYNFLVAGFVSTTSYLRTCKYKP